MRVGAGDAAARTGAHADAATPMIPDQTRRVLLIEDDVHIAEVVGVQLRADGYALTHAADGLVGLQYAERGTWDAVILDLMLPRVDGLEICRRVRASSPGTPIIIISARGSEVHRILGLEMGADDYLPKPFSLLELQARLRALIRRVDAIRATHAATPRRLDVDGLSIDRLTRDVRVDGRRAELTPREFDLLVLLAEHPGQVFSRAELLTRIWGSGHDGYEHTVNTHINRLRGKIEPDPRQPRRLVTVWGRGYRLDPSPPASGDGRGPRIDGGAPS